MTTTSDIAKLEEAWREPMTDADLGLVEKMIDGAMHDKSCRRDVGVCQCPMAHILHRLVATVRAERERSTGNQIETIDRLVKAVYCQDNALGEYFAEYGFSHSDSYPQDRMWECECPLHVAIRETHQALDAYEAARDARGKK